MECKSILLKKNLNYFIEAVHAFCWIYINIGVTDQADTSKHRDDQYGLRYGDQYGLRSHHHEVLRSISFRKKENIYFCPFTRKISSKIKHTRITSHFPWKKSKKTGIVSISLGKKQIDRDHFSYLLRKS